MPPEGYARRSARVLLLDGGGRILLLRFYTNRGRTSTAWFTPGGGVADGEHPRQTAIRELREEIGLAIEPEQLGPMVAETSGYVEWDWVNGWLRDDFYLCRVGAHQVDTTGLEPRERAALAGHRWWTVAELAATSETVYPFELAPLVADLLAGRAPAEPVRLPWHH